MMKYAKWIIFIALFAFSENAPAAENQQLDEHNIAKSLKALTYQVLHYVNSANRGRNRPVKEEFEGNVINATILPTGGHAVVKFQPYHDFRAEAHLDVSLDVYLQDFDHHFVTEIFPVEIGFVHLNKDEIVYNGRITWNSIATTKLHFPKSDNLDIKLLPSEYQYKPNEEENVKQAIKSLIKSIWQKYTERENYLKRIAYLPYLGGFDNSYNSGRLSRNPSYFLDTILGTNYTLNNVTLHGLWNVHSISYNTSNLEVSPQIEIGQVTGTMVQQFLSETDKPQELGFNATNILISMNQKADRKVDVQIGGYSLKNTKTDEFLADDESKLIVKQIESAIAASNVVSDWKKYN